MTESKILDIGIVCITLLAIAEAIIIFNLLH